MLFENPFASPLFLPTLARWAILFGAALAALLLLRRRAGATADASLLVRWRTWFLIAPIYLLGVLGGIVPTALLVMALTVQGLREYARVITSYSIHYTKLYEETAPLSIQYHCRSFYLDLLQMPD